MTDRRESIEELEEIGIELSRLRRRVGDLAHKLESREEEEARAWARAEARKVLADPNTVIFDSETTGLYDADFIEVAAINVKGEVLLNSRVRPVGYEVRYDDGEVRQYEAQEIENGAFEVHGITDSDLEGEPTFAELYPQVRAALMGKRVAVYNYEFDSQVLADSVRRYDLEPFEVGASACIMWIYAKYLATWSNYRRNWLWPSLPESKHNALDDCRAALEVLRTVAAETPDEARERAGIEEKLERERQQAEELRTEGMTDEDEIRAVISREQEERESDFESIPF